MKNLNKFVVLSVLLFAWIGFALPSLISHRSYELPAIGINITLFGAYFAVRSGIKYLNKKETNNEDP